MGLSGTSGPMRGAYSVLNFSTPSIVPGIPGVGAQQVNMWSWNTPFDMEIVDIQFWAASVSGGVRVNVLAGGASILDASGGVFDTTTRGSFADAKTQGVTLYAGTFTGVGASTTATVSRGIFGTTATSIVRPPTTSAKEKRCPQRPRNSAPSSPVAGRCIVI